MTPRSFRTITAVFFAFFAGCVPRQPPEPELVPVPTPKILVEENIVVPERPDLAILQVDEQIEKPRNTVVVSGTVLNRGPGRARNLRVTVSALDESGGELLTLPAEVASPTLEPNSSTTFSVRLERPPGTARYHVVAESR